MIRSCVALIALVLAAPAYGQEPVGCDKFKWPLDKERAMLAAPEPIASGGEIAEPLKAALKISLPPLANAKLPSPPSRAPKNANSYAGFVRAAAPPKAGTYRITLSHGAWIDVIQEGKEVKSAAFSGALGCEGVRKSVKFELTAAPFIIEISGMSANAIGVVVTPD
ncbi:MAG TPA: hypothetical protein VFW22_11515 [Pseudolabrys sp.]|nr:hypothetical protein [Pseudolabrys sp.]